MNDDLILSSWTVDNLIDLTDKRRPDEGFGFLMKDV